MAQVNIEDTPKSKGARNKVLALVNTTKDSTIGMYYNMTVMS